MATYGNRSDKPAKLKTSWNGQAVDPNDPPVLVRKLESTAAGCHWLRERWEELRLEPGAAGKFWQAHDRFKVLRLLGRQPIHANQDRRIAQIFTASHALNPVQQNEFADLSSDLSPKQLIHYRKGIRAKWPELFETTDTAACRQVLMDLIDCCIEELDGRLEVYETNAGTISAKTVSRLCSASSAEGERSNKHKMKCSNLFFRGVDAYARYQARNKARPDAPNRAWPPESPRMKRGYAIDPLGVTPNPSNAQTEAPDEIDISWALADQEDGQAGIVGGTHSDGVSVSDGVSASDSVSVSDSTIDPAGVIVSDSGSLPEGPELDWCAPGAGENARDVSVSDAPETHGEGLAGQDENPENVTNEATEYEHEITIENREIRGNFANSGVEAGLDKPDEGPGEREPQIVNLEPDFSDLESEVLKLKSDIADFETEHDRSGARRDRAARRAPRSEQERRRQRQERRRKHLELAFQEGVKGMKALGLPAGDMLEGLTLSSPLTAEILREQLRQLPRVAPPRVASAGSRE
jgi:hypothetical protein